MRAVLDSPLLVPRPEAGYPDVLGTLPVRGREDAQVLLAAGAEGVPLLAFANRGLGKVGVWSADLLGSWGREGRQPEPFPGPVGSRRRVLMPSVRSSTVRTAR